jgi:hypothetical protein
LVLFREGLVVGDASVLVVAQVEAVLGGEVYGHRGEGVVLEERGPVGVLRLGFLWQGD